jgi:hypothetical protein
MVSKKDFLRSVFAISLTSILGMPVFAADEPLSFSSPGIVNKSLPAQLQTPPNELLGIHRAETPPHSSLIEKISETFPTLPLQSQMPDNPNISRSDTSLFLSEKSTLELEKLKLEVQNLELERKRRLAEIDKIGAEFKKLQRENDYYFLGWLSIFGPILVAAGAIIIQSWVSFKLKLMEANMKASEFILNSYSPFMAVKRLEILMKLSPDIYDKPKLKEFIEKFDFSEFPGTWKREMLLILFKEVAAKSRNKREVIDAFKKAFPYDHWLNERFPT